MRLYLQLRCVVSKTKALTSTICVQGQAVKWASTTTSAPTTTTTTNVRRLSGRRSSLWFHRLSWTVATANHVPFTVLWVRMCISRASPLFAIGPSAPSWFWVYLLPVIGAISHFKEIKTKQMINRWYRQKLGIRKKKQDRTITEIGKINGARRNRFLYFPLGLRAGWWTDINWMLLRIGVRRSGGTVNPALRYLKMRAWCSSSCHCATVNDGGGWAPIHIDGGTLILVLQ